MALEQPVIDVAIEGPPDSQGDKQKAMTAFQRPANTPARACVPRWGLMRGFSQRTRPFHPDALRDERHGIFLSKFRGALSVSFTPQRLGGTTPMRLRSGLLAHVK